MCIPAVVILLVGGPLWSIYVAFFLVGLGNGPIYPNLLHLTAKNFGEDVSQSVMSTQMAAAYTGVVFTQILFGLISKYAGMNAYPIVLFITFIVMVAFIAMFLLKKKRVFN